jgi:AcrR family transcriptional regulator
VLYTLPRDLAGGALTKVQLRKAAKAVQATGRRAQGERTRQAILEAAVHIASAEGLEGLTIGRLAMELSMSKSGLFAHFGSKEDLQVACFFAAAASEFDSRPGPVRDRIAEIMKEWLSVLRNAIVEAQTAGQLKKDIDATQLAFEFNSLELGANWAFQLYGDLKAFNRARDAIRERLSRYATASGVSLLSIVKPKPVRIRA